MREEIRKNPELSVAIIMMLTSGGQRGDVARCRALGLAGYLTKPVGEAELLDAILRVTGSTRPETTRIAGDGARGARRRVGPCAFCWPRTTR